MSKFLNKTGSIAGKVMHGTGKAVVSISAAIIKEGKITLDKRINETSKYEEMFKNYDNSSLENTYKSTQGTKKLRLEIF